MEMHYLSMLVCIAMNEKMCNTTPKLFSAFLSPLFLAGKSLSMQCNQCVCVWRVDIDISRPHMSNELCTFLISSWPWPFEIYWKKQYAWIYISCAFIKNQGCCTNNCTLQGKIFPSLWLFLQKHANGIFWALIPWSVLMCIVFLKLSKYGV